MIKVCDKEEIEKYLYSTYTIDPLDEPSIHCIYSDDREIYRITIGNKSFIYKTAGSSKKSFDEFEIEYFILKNIWSSVSVKPNMPEPLLLLKGRGFLMTECSGEVMKELYYRSISPFNSKAKLKTAIEMSAIWLSDFHCVETKDDDYHAYYINRLTHLKRMIEVIESFNVNVSLTEKFAEITKMFIDTESSKAGFICRLHGNFSLRNILAGTDSVSLIDFEDSKIDTIYYDLGMFISELLNKSIYIFNMPLNKRLIKIFIKEYSKSKLIDNQLLRVYVLYHLVWSYYEVVQRKKPGSKLKALALQWKKYHLQIMITKAINNQIL